MKYQKRSLVRYLERFSCKENEQLANQRDAISVTEFLSIERDVISKLDPVKTDNLLDLGCGTGLLSIACSKYAKRVFAIDIAKGLTQRAKQNITRRNIHNIDVIRTDIVDLPFKANIFDKILFYNVTLYFPRGELKKALLEMRRVLKKDGRILIGDISDLRHAKEYLSYRGIRSPRILTLFKFLRRLKKLFPFFRGGYWYTSDEILHFLKKTGLDGRLLKQNTQLPYHAWRYDCLAYSVGGKGYERRLSK